MKKVLVACMSILLLMVASLSACKPIPIDEHIDTSKTQIFVANYDGGVGSEWLEELKIRFEDFYKDEVYEEGKKGVQVILRKSKNYQSQTLIDTAKFAPEEIFFIESVDYNSFVLKDNFLDITDMMNESLKDKFGEDTTLAEKLKDSYRDYLGIKKGEETKYYGVPHYEAFGGLAYNRTIFDSYFLYYAKDGGWVTSLDEERAAGPDGAYGTYDDGLPATYEEFYKLCDRMKLFDVTPMIWSGQYADLQASYLYRALHANYEGAEQLMLNFSFNGTANHIVESIDPDGTPNLVSKAITPANGYELWQQAGRYYALEFMETIIDNGYLGANSFNLTYSHTDAQEDFVKGVYENKPIGMLADGSWWEREAATANKFVGLPDEYSRANSKFGFMPLPHATEEKVGDRGVLADSNYALGFIRSTIAPYKAEIAKNFLQFCCTNESLSKFSEITGMGKGFDYELTEEQLSELNFYTRSLYDLKTTSDVLLPASSTELFLANQGFFNYCSSSWQSTVGATTYNQVVSALESHGVSAVDYFKGMSINSEMWTRTYEQYFD